MNENLNEYSQIGMAMAKVEREIHQKIEHERMMAEGAN